MLRADQTTKSELRFQFEVWRLLAAVTLFAIAFGLLKWMLWEIAFYGGGFFPSLLIAGAIVSIAGGIGSLFRRASEFAMRTFLAIVYFIGEFL